MELMGVTRTMGEIEMNKSQTAKKDIKMNKSQAAKKDMIAINNLLKEITLNINCLDKKHSCIQPKCLGMKALFLVLLKDFLNYLIHIGGLACCLTKNFNLCSLGRDSYLFCTR